MLLGAGTVTTAPVFVHWLCGLLVPACGQAWARRPVQPPGLLAGLLGAGSSGPFHKSIN